MAKTLKEIREEFVGEISDENGQYNGTLATVTKAFLNAETKFIALLDTLPGEDMDIDDPKNRRCSKHYAYNRRGAEVRERIRQAKGE